MPSNLLLPFSGARLREAREKAGLGRPAAARNCKALGRPVSPQHLGRIERGESKPKPELLTVLAEVVGCSVDDLLDSADEVVAS